MDQSEHGRAEYSYVLDTGRTDLVLGEALGGKAYISKIKSLIFMADQIWALKKQVGLEQEL